MDVRDEKATVTVPFSGSNFTLQWVAELVKENDKWFIINIKY